MKIKVARQVLKVPYEIASQAFSALMDTKKVYDCQFIDATYETVLAVGGFDKLVPAVKELYKASDIALYLDGLEVVGISILKNDDEKKLCTFMVNPEYRKKGYSKLLLEDSFEYLKTEKPIITIPEFRLDEFSSIINAYGWEESSIIDNYYSKEIEFNGEKQLIKR